MQRVQQQQQQDCTYTPCHHIWTQCKEVDSRFLILYTCMYAVDWWVIAVQCCLSVRYLYAHYVGTESHSSIVFIRQSLHYGIYIVHSVYFVCRMYHGDSVLCNFKRILCTSYINYTTRMCFVCIFTCNRKRLCIKTEVFI